jgi:hypothetical protein
MSRPWFTVDFEDNTVAEKIEHLSSKDGRHKLLSDEDGVSLYVEIVDGKVQRYENVDSAGAPVEGTYMTASKPSGPGGGTQDLCFRCHLSGGRWHCVPIVCPIEV